MKHVTTKEQAEIEEVCDSVGLPEVLLDQVNETPADAPKALRPKKKNGRPVGSKNKETLFKEQMQVLFEKKISKDFEDVLMTVVQAAKDGDMVAARMLMDRVVPVSKAVDLDELGKSKGISIEINVGSLEEPKVIN